jgi:beta-N-acetylhexosaminidase
MTGPTERELALRTLLPAFPGAVAPDWARRLVAEGLGGFALFGANVVDREQLTGLTAALRAERPDVVLAIDEEGGDVTRLCYATGSPYPGNAALGAVDDLDLTRAIYRSIGAELVAVGVTLDMAPAVDVNSTDDNPAIGTRSFGPDPFRVAAHAMAAVTGLQEAGVAACAKHFPGHGATELDSHLDLPLVDATEELLWRRELPPFQAAVAAGVRAVMTAHIRVPFLTGELPATFSSEALVRLLRKELGFGGTIVSDGLEMRGASGAIGVPEAAVRALAAGNDLLCIGGEYAKPGTVGAEEIIEATVAAIIEAVRAGRLSAERLAEAAARNALLAIPRPPAPPAWSEEIGLTAARRALRVEGQLPPLHDALVIQLDGPASAAVGEVPWGLPAATVLRPPLAAAVDEVRAAAQARPVVVLSRDTHRVPWAREFVEALAAAQPVVLVEMGWPAAWRPAGIVAYVATHGASRATSRALAELLFD